MDGKLIKAGYGNDYFDGNVIEDYKITGPDNYPDRRIVLLAIAQARQQTKSADEPTLEADTGPIIITQSEPNVVPTVVDATSNLLTESTVPIVDAASNML